MAPELESLAEQAMKLTTQERAELVMRLLHTLEDEPVEGEGSEEEILQAWVEEAMRRNAELDSGQATARPWDEVLRDLRAKYP